MNTTKAGSNNGRVCAGTGGPRACRHRFGVYGPGRIKA
jgi:hypothetical protein